VKFWHPRALAVRIIARMTSRRRQRQSVQWPFWLLLLAWVCANSPQAAVVAVLTWMDHARQFSHQQRLTAEVAFLLVGEKLPATETVASSQSPKKSPAPALPPGAVIKKIEFAVHRTSELLPPSARALTHAVTESALHDTLRAPPPHEPPRAVVVVA
jgi:hypothetical protein